MSKNLERFDHAVVLMLENRSFDNMLGYLYAPDEAPRGQTFDGVIGKDLSNPIPADVAGPPDRVIRVAENPGTFAAMQWPNPDPGEEYSHVNTQLFNVFAPESNRFLSVKDVQPPYNLPTDYRSCSDPVPQMQGFVNDYIANYVSSQKDCQNPEDCLPTQAEYEIIMRCFTPSPQTGVPVISQLARSFAVCDQWHCAVPSQTFCNRSFFNSASSSGFVVNGIDIANYAKWPRENTQPTIFNVLENNNLSWKIYFDAEDVFPLTLLIHFEPLKEFTFTHFGHMDDFRRDARDGKLPDYAFIEPRLFINHNDEHPPVDIFGSEHSSVLAGEILIKEVYDTIRQSSSPRGSNAENTLLAITYDEHGGCYDHVAPPCATPPGPGAPAGEMGFTFDRLGIRIPTILISSYIEEGTVCNTALQHTSMIKTLFDKWGLDPLTNRDASATPFTEVFTDTFRPASQWPQVTDRPYKAKKRLNLSHPLNHLQQSLLRTVAATFEEVERIDDKGIDTVGEAVKYMKRKFKLLKI